MQVKSQSIAKAEALIAINEQKFTTARKKLEELEAARTRVEENLSTYSSRLESLRAQLAAKPSWRLRKCVSMRYIASENKSVLWLIKIISLPPVFLFFRDRTLNSSRVFVSLLSFLAQIIKVS